MKVIYCVLVLLLLLSLSSSCDSLEGCQVPWGAQDVKEDAGVDVTKDAATDEALETADAAHKADAVKDTEAMDVEGKGAAREQADEPREN